jgi:hypoxanthine phosphoribosyltransferase
MIPTPIDALRRRHPSVSAPPGARFANPSEELFANLLTLYGLTWSYEPVEFPLEWNDHGQPSRGFRPDFYLPARRLFIELTVLDQRLVTKKNRKIRRFRVLYPEVELLVVYRRDFERLLERHDLGMPPNIAA